MIKKSLKIFLILLVLFGICTICSSAANINLDLPGIDNTQLTNNTTDNSIIDNSQIEGDTTNTNNILDYTEPTTQDTPLDDMQTLQPTAGSSSNSGLSVTNIINILLITVGVILILLAIAIMIRLK